MTGKVLNSGTTGILVLILPMAIAIVVLFTAWQWILLFLVLTIGWKIWQNYQWQQWCLQVNPFFNQLIKENRGCLTSMDLSVKANMTARSAHRFLEKKAQEYGAQRKVYEDQGTVYYFLTVSALGSIFDDSEPLLEVISEEVDAKKKHQLASTSSPIHQSVVREIKPLVNLEEKPAIATPKTQLSVEVEVDKPQELPVVTPSLVTEDFKTQETSTTDPQIMDLLLIQSDLAKRLDTNPSTIFRRKSDPDFPTWTQSKDPDGIAWKYVPETKMFVPFNSSTDV